jgi:hypothetical protein
LDYRTLVETLTPEQKRELQRHDIPSPRLSDWRSGKRRPTLAQAKVLAIVTGADFHALTEELAELEATPHQVSFFRGALARASALIPVAVFSLAFYPATPSEAAPALDPRSQLVTVCILC